MMNELIFLNDLHLNILELGYGYIPEENLPIGCLSHYHQNNMNKPQYLQIADVNAKLFRKEITYATSLRLIAEIREKFEKKV